MSSSWATRRVNRRGGHCHKWELLGGIVRRIVEQIAF